jgi:hypothetical protein
MKRPKMLATGFKEYLLEIANKLKILSGGLVIGNLRSPHDVRKKNDRFSDVFVYLSGFGRDAGYRFFLSSSRHFFGLTRQTR